MMSRNLAGLALLLCSCFPQAAAAQEPRPKDPSFDSAGVPIHYIVTGREDGEPVVLVHGFADTIEGGWATVIAALKKDFKVIALDNRGHGGSGKPHDPKKYGVEMVHDVARLLDHLKIDKAHIVGWSMGAGIALGFAVHHPERTRTVTLGGAGFNPRHKDLILTVADSLEKGDGIGPVILALTPKNRPKPTPEALKRINDAFHAVNDAKALAALCRAAARDMLTEKEVEGVRVPMLAIIGADDPLRADVDQLKKLLPMTKVVVIDKADHWSAITRPELVSGLRQFFADHRQPPKK